MSDLHQLPKAIIDYYCQHLSPSVFADYRSFIEFSLPPPQETALTTLWTIYAASASHEGQRTIEPLLAALISASALSNKRFKVSHCYAQGILSIHQACAGLGKSSDPYIDALSTICGYSVSISATAKSSTYYPQVLKSQHVIVEIATSESLFPSAYGITGQILAKHRDQCEAPWVTVQRLLLGEVLLGEKTRQVSRKKSKSEQEHQALESLAPKLFKKPLTPGKSAIKAIKKMQTSERQQTEYEEEISESRLGLANEALSYIDDDQELPITVVKPLVQARNELDKADPVILRQAARGMQNDAIKHNNPSLSQTNIYSPLTLCIAVVYVETTDWQLAAFCLLSMLTGLPVNRLLTVIDPEGDEWDLITDLHESTLTYKVKNHIASGESATNIMTLSIPRGLCAALTSSSGTLNRANAQERYKRLLARDTLESPRFPPRLSQWAHTQHLILGDYLRPFDRRILAGDLGYTYRSESAYTELDIRSLNRQFARAVGNFSRLASTRGFSSSSLVANLSVAVSDTYPKPYIGTPKGRDIDKFKTLVNKAFDRKHRLSRKYIRATLEEQLHINIDQLNLSNTLLELTLLCCCVCRPNWERIELDAGPTGWLIEDKDSAQGREPRAFYPFGGKEQTEGRTVIQKTLDTLRLELDQLKTTISFGSLELKELENQYAYQPIKLAPVKQGRILEQTVLTKSDLAELCVALLTIDDEELPVANTVRGLVASLRPEYDDNDLPQLSIATQRALLGHHQPGLGLYTTFCSRVGDTRAEQQELINWILNRVDLKAVKVGKWLK